MNDQETLDLYTLFPFLKEVQLHPHNFTSVKLSAGVCAFTEGDDSTLIPLLLKGSIKVLKIAESGREILLYRIQPGETCIIMLSSALGDIPYPATAIVEQEVEVLMVPTQLYIDWMHHVPAVQNFTFKSLAQRLGSVMALVEEITFKRIDIRLIRFLLAHTTEKQPLLHQTHEEIAVELGTVREVISRLLKNLEVDHLLLLSRGKIGITQRQELEKMLLNR